MINYYRGNINRLHRLDVHEVEKSKIMGILNNFRYMECLWVEDSFCHHQNGAVSNFIKQCNPLLIFSAFPFQQNIYYVTEHELISTYPEPTIGTDYYVRNCRPAQYVTTRVNKDYRFHPLRNSK